MYYIGTYDATNESDNESKLLRNDYIILTAVMTCFFLFETITLRDHDNYDTVPTVESAYSIFVH